VIYSQIRDIEFLLNNAVNSEYRTADFRDLTEDKTLINITVFHFTSFVMYLKA